MLGMREHTLCSPFRANAHTILVSMSCEKSKSNFINCQQHTLMKLCIISYSPYQNNSTLEKLINKNTRLNTHLHVYDNMHIFICYE